MQCGLWKHNPAPLTRLLGVSRIYASNNLLHPWCRELLSSLVWTQSHGVGTSQYVIISAVQTAQQLNQLILSEVTSALCLCLFKDKRKEARPPFVFPRFHPAGEEREVCYSSFLVTSKPAHPGRALAYLLAGRAPLRAFIMLLLGKSFSLSQKHLSEKTLHLPSFAYLVTESF